MLRAAPMSDDVLALLDRKRVLLERRQQTPSVLVPEIERELREIDRALTRLEMEDVPPTSRNRNTHISSRNPGPVGWSEDSSMRTEVKHDRTPSSADRFLRTAALCALIGLLGSAPATARGGGHGMGHFGLHGGEHMMAPAYVLITVSTVSDADTFKKAVQDMTTAVAPFTGRLEVDAKKPPAWEGAAAEQVVMIRFADAEQAQAWKNSDAFKSFDARPPQELLFDHAACPGSSDAGRPRRTRAFRSQGIRA
jgi:uncharacterized protein (DUF1330 family)